jgi:uncharacterized protein YbjT (DUF2867 family)
MFAVLGATGRVGRTTAAALLRAGRKVRAVVRDEGRAQTLAASGCEIAVADVQDATALASAIEGAAAVQVICPVNPRAEDAAGDMRRSIEALRQALGTARPQSILAISDYGAELSGPTGVTSLFHLLEEMLRDLPSHVTFLRSAEHMQNWARLLGIAAQTGRLPSLHHPLTKLFPTVSAFDVGAVSADLLLEATDRSHSPRILHVEGPRRYTSADVAAAATELFGREVSAYALPRTEWEETLRRGGVNESYIPLVTELFEAHNAGLIDAERAAGPIRKGQTGLADALRPLAAGL